MWQISEIESSDRTTTFQLLEDGQLLSHRQFLQQMAGSRLFREFYNSLLADSGYLAFLWENKPVTSHNLDEPYECTLVNSPFLAGKSPDSNTFRQYFEEQQHVVTFPNLGNDAQLIAPCPRNQNSVYCHIGTFVRGADAEQINDFWRFVAQQMLDAIEDQPRWLSTNGMGVFWLHVRIDIRPKYYQTEAYKSL